MDSIWVGTPNVFTVSQIDPRSNEVVAEFPIPPGANPCGDIAVADDRVQVSSCRVEPSISVIDPGSGAVEVAGPKRVSQLVRFDHDSGSLTVVTVPGVTAIGGVAVAFDSVWVSDEANGTVTRFPAGLLGNT